MREKRNGCFDSSLSYIIKVQGNQKLFINFMFCCQILFHLSCLDIYIYISTEKSEELNVNLFRPWSALTPHQCETKLGRKGWTRNYFAKYLHKLNPIFHQQSTSESNQLPFRRVQYKIWISICQIFGNGANKIMVWGNWVNASKVKLNFKPGNCLARQLPCLV